MQQTLNGLDFDRGLWGACSRGDFDRAQELLNQREHDPNQRDLSGYTPLHYAARKGHVQLCQLLLRNKAQVDPFAGESAATPLHRACGAGHVEVSDAPGTASRAPFLRAAVCIPSFNSPALDNHYSEGLNAQVAKLLLGHKACPALQVCLRQCLTWGVDASKSFFTCSALALQSSGEEERTRSGRCDLEPS